LQRHADEMAALAAGGKTLDPQQLEQLMSELQQMSGQMEDEVARPAAHLSAVARLMAKADEFVRLTLQQKELVKLLRRFKDHEGPLSRLEQMELAELSAGERRIKDGLKRFLERVPELAEDLPDEKEYENLKGQVKEFLKAVEDAGIMKDLEDSTEKLAALDGPGGFPKAKEAYEKMDALVAKCKGMPQQGQQSMCLCFRPSLSQSLGNSLQQILGAMQSKGMGGSGQGGYGLMGDDMGIYGPDMQLAQSGGSGPDEPAAGEREPRAEGGDSDVSEAETPRDGGPPRIRLQRDAKFPLRYRKLVGEYFRAVAESQE
jgi:hypothetical protein